MSNRSYLYSIDFNPSEREKTEADKVCALSEYSSSIPLAYQVLISADAKLCRSLIWEHEHPIALLADFEKGRKRLFNFLAAIEKTEAFDKSKFAAEVEKTKAFFNDPANGGKYLLLELGEIFDFTDEPHETQALNFLNELKQIEQTVSSYLTELAKKKKEREDIELGIKINESGAFRFIFRSLAGRQQEVNEKKLKKLDEAMWWDLGIDNWTSILYYDLSNKNNEQKAGGDFGTQLVVSKKDTLVISNDEKLKLVKELRAILSSGNYSVELIVRPSGFIELENNALAIILSGYYSGDDEEELEELAKGEDLEEAEEIAGKLQEAMGGGFEIKASFEEW